MTGTETTAEGRAAHGKEAAAARGAPGPAEEATPPGRDHVCNVAFCPIGLALSTVQGAAPDVLEHLLKAAQEFFLAARAVMDNRAEDLGGERREDGLERIEIT
jgi:hypothetical protein